MTPREVAAAIRLLAAQVESYDLVLGHSAGIESGSELDASGQRRHNGVERLRIEVTVARVKPGYCPETEFRP